MSWPNFIVIGAARSGTTSLHHFLGQHPDVYICPVKEPNYFAFGGEFGELHGPGIEQLAEHSVVEREGYLDLFSGAGDETAVGEVSPRYMIADGCAERIQASLPRVKLIAILRHPVERAWSSFIGRRKDGWETCDDFRQAFAVEPARMAAKQSMGLHFSAGRYAEKLEGYFARFDREQIRVALYDDLQTKPAALMADLFRFLGVDPVFEVDTSRVHNPSGDILNPAVRVFWRRSERLRRSLRGWINVKWRDRAYTSLITRNLERRELPPELRAEYIEYFRDDILQLSALIDRDLDHWL